MDKPKLAVLGLGSRSTSFYLSRLNAEFQEKKGGYSTCPLWLLNTDFNAINALLPNTSKQLDSIVNAYIKEIEQLDVEYVLIPNITLHETVDRLKINKKILHPIDLTISKIKENKWNKVVLFGSLFSMKSTYISDAFKAEGIAVIAPSEKDMEFIDSVRKEIYNEAETEDLIKAYHLLINQYATNTPVIIACTELSILKPNGHKHLLDMADVQINEAVNMYHF